MDKECDVICQICKDSSIVPLKIRVTDDDGEYQEYKILAFKQISNGFGVNIKSYKCKIKVFDMIKIITLSYFVNQVKWTCKVEP